MVHFSTADSWYAKTAHSAPSHPKLEGATDTDIAVLGAGYAGLMTALTLAERGYRVIVVEAKRVGWGASGRNGGQIITGFNRGMADLEQIVGSADTQALWTLSREARRLLIDTIERYKIACDLTWGYIFAAANRSQTTELNELAREWAHFGHGGVQSLDRAAIQGIVESKRYVAGLYDADGGHLHPLNYVLGLADACLQNGVTIFEQSPVRRIETGKKPSFETAEGKVRATTLVIAGNALLGTLVPQLASKIAGVGTYIVSTPPLGTSRIRTVLRDDVAVCDLDLILNYFRRTPDHRLLFGSRVSYSGREPKQLRDKMRQSMLGVFPQLHDLHIDQCWGGLVDITINRLPHIGRLDPTVYFAHGFSGQGVALAGMAGKVIAEAIAGQAEHFDVFARIPHRKFPGGPLRRPALVLAMLWYRLQELL